MLRNQKHDLFRKYRRWLIHYHQYSKFNQDFSFIIKQCKINYFWNEFHLCANIIKKTCKTINSVIGSKRRRGLSEITKERVHYTSCALHIVCITKERVHYTSNTDMAQCFNHYFGFIVINFWSDIPSTDLSPLSYVGYRMTISI